MFHFKLETAFNEWGAKVSKSERITAIVIAILIAIIVLPIFIAIGFGFLEMIYIIFKGLLPVLFEFTKLILTYPLILIVAALAEITGNHNEILKYDTLSEIIFFVIVLISFKINKFIPLFLYIVFPIFFGLAGLSFAAVHGILGL